MPARNDRDLGLDRPISRRDFLDGAIIGTGALLASGWLAACTAGAASSSTEPPTANTTRLETAPLPPYPPILQGIRGQTDAAYAIPHMVRDGTFWSEAGTAENTGESYDLVVVGAGLSGLSAAFFARQREPDARILILDTNDDFGGHARRNEFAGVADRPGGLLIGYGGTEAIEAPSVYSDVAMGLLHDVGIDLSRFRGYYDNSFWSDLGQLIFFDAEHWGRDHVAIRRSGLTPATYLDGAPMAQRAIRELDAFQTAPTDYLPHRSDLEKKAMLAKVTYERYLIEIAGVHPDVVGFLSTRPADAWGYGIDALGAIDAWASGYPGFDGLALSTDEPSRYNSPSVKREWDATDPYIYHFPDGNAGIARLLVRHLVPGSLPGSTMEDAVLARMDYSVLDAESNDVRIRLGSPVVRVAHVGRDADASSSVDVTYVRDGQLHRVRAAGVVLACWYSMARYIVDGLPDEQVRAAGSMGRIPLIYATVQLRTRSAFEKLTTWGGRAVGTGAEWVSFFLDYPISMGGYDYPLDLAQPGLLHMVATPAVPGMPLREAVKAGRTGMYQRPFDDYERSIRDLTARAFGGGGFDPAADIQGLTLNRWAHGYSMEYVMPWDSAFYPDGPLPGDVASRPFGRITFANTDRSARAYTDSAIDAAYAAVSEQPALRMHG